MCVCVSVFVSVSLSRGVALKCVCAYEPLVKGQREVNIVFLHLVLLYSFETRFLTRDSIYSV